MEHEIHYIIVLAGGLDKKGEPHDFVKLRLDRATDIYCNNVEKGIKTKIICLGGGTYHKPPNLNKLNYVIHESTSCAIYLVENGVNENHIMREWSSYDTIANGLYCLTNFIIPLEIKSFDLITSNFHMPRSKLIFNYLTKFTKQEININYINVDDTIIPEETLIERTRREGQSCKNFEKLCEEKETLHDFIEWFYTEHNAYKAVVTYYPMDNKMKNTY